MTHHAYEWARSRGLNAEAEVYRQEANRASYGASRASADALRLNSESLADVPRSSTSSVFASGWNTGDHAAGLSQGTARSQLNGTLGIGFYAGFGGELEAEFVNGDIVGGKAGAGVGYGVHLTRGSVTGALMQGPISGLKSPSIAELPDVQQPGEVRVGTSLSVGAGIGLVGVDGSIGTGASLTDIGRRGYVQGAINATSSPVLPKVGAEVKLNVLEFIVKPRSPSGSNGSKR